MNRKIKSYKDLIVWQRSIDFVTEIYELTKMLPTDEKFGLVSQMRRSGVSVPSNLAEGHARIGKNEFKHFVSISLGSLAELETHILICQNLNYFTKIISDDLLENTNEINKMLHGLYKSLNKK